MKTNLVKSRWGKKRSPSSIVRISKRSRLILDRLPDLVRRSWLDAVILNASKLPIYDSLVKEGRKIGVDNWVKDLVK